MSVHPAQSVLPLTPRLPGRYMSIIPVHAGFLGAQLLAGLAILLQLNAYSIVLGASALALVFTYPLMKRVTHWVRAAKPAQNRPQPRAYLHALCSTSPGPRLLAGQSA